MVNADTPFERMRALVSKKLSHDLKHLELCVIESRIQMNASDRFYELHFFQECAIHIILLNSFIKVMCILLSYLGVRNFRRNTSLNRNNQV